MQKMESLDKKAALIAAILPTHRGMAAASSQRETIAATCTELEAQNPTPNPTGSMNLLAGKWRLLYTTTPMEENTTLARLSFGFFPPIPVHLGEIYQHISDADSTYENTIEISESTVELALTIRARFEILSPQRLQINFEQAVLSPKSSEAKWQNWLKKIEDSYAANLSCSVPLSASGWVDTTYLDSELRLSRGNIGNLYILSKV